MRKHGIFILLSVFAAVIPVSCDNRYELSDPDFDITSIAVVKAGQKLDFNIAGNADMVTFYSGETGSCYDYKVDHRVVTGSMGLDFVTTTSNAGTVGHPNPSSVPLSYSTDFSGIYTREEMEKATWTDITDKFTFPTDINQANVKSGHLDITDMFPDEYTPIYFRFYYSVEQYDAAKYNFQGNGRTQWFFINFAVNCTTGDETSTLYDMYSQNWQIIPGLNYENIPTANLPILPTASQQLSLRSQFTPKFPIQYWAVCGPIEYKATVDYGVDTGLAIKSYSDPWLPVYSYTYETPGEYTATFEGINANYKGVRTVVKKIKVKVVEDTGNISGTTPGEWD